MQGAVVLRNQITASSKSALLESKVIQINGHKRLKRFQKIQ